MTNKTGPWDAKSDGSEALPALLTGVKGAGLNLRVGLGKTFPGAQV